jgi:hypothetical protein
VRAVWPGRDATTEALTPDYRRGPGSESFVCINRSSTFVIRFCFSTNRLSSSVAEACAIRAKETGLVRRIWNFDLLFLNEILE